MEKCSLGELLNAECHKLSFCRSSSVKPFRELPTDDQKIVLLRCQLPLDTALNYLCGHHEQLYLYRYAHNQTSCLEPFFQHKIPVKKSLRNVTLEMSVKFSEKVNMIPGQKLCKNCLQTILNMDIASPETNCSSSSTDLPPHPEEDVAGTMDKVCEALQQSSFALQKRLENHRDSYVSAKVQRVKDSFNNEAFKIKSAPAVAQMSRS